MYTCKYDSLSSQVLSSESLPDAVSVLFCAATLCQATGSIDVLPNYAQPKHFLDCKARCIIHTTYKGQADKQSAWVLGLIEGNPGLSHGISTL